MMNPMWHVLYIFALGLLLALSVTLYTSRPMECSRRPGYIYVANPKVCVPALPFAPAFVPAKERLP